MINGTADTHADRGQLWFALSAAAAGIALGHAVQIANGEYHPVAVAWLIVGLATALAATLRAATARREVAAGRVLRPFLVGAIVWQFFQFASRGQASFLQGDVAHISAQLELGAAVGVWAAVVAVTGLGEVTRIRHAAVGVMLAAFVAVACLVIRHSPAPRIDVFILLRDSAEALLRGQNPYRLTIPNLYGSAAPLFYGDVAIEQGRAHVGFMYPPLSLLMLLPGQLLGDFRYSIVAAIAGAAAFIAYCNPGRIATAAAALLLFTPRTLFVVEQGWTDAFSLLLLAFTVFAACRARRLLPLALAALLTSKQYAVIFFPTVFLLRPLYRSWPEFLRAVGGGLLVALVLALPFLLWDTKAAFYNLVTLQGLLPFRPDALNFFGWWYHVSGQQLPSWIGFAAAALANVAMLARAPRTPAGFAAATVTVLLVFVAFNRQAFCNYYHLILGGMFTAVAAAIPPSTPEPAAVSSCREP